MELNLASRPIDNRRRFYVLTITGAVVLLFFAVVQGGTWTRDWWSSRNLTRQTERLRAERTRLQGEQQRREGELRLPQARDVIERAHFLNSLILQKGVSWTQIFMDLERLMPDRVQVLSIRPEVLENNQIHLDMTVAGESMAQLLEFLRRIERSDRFGTPVLSSERPPATGAQDQSIQLALSVTYVQKQ